MMQETADEITSPAFECDSAKVNPSEVASISTWLCPIASDSERRGILPMTATEYFNLVDRSGRLMGSKKGGAIDADLAPILLRIGANPEGWIETVSRFGCKFSVAAGLIYNLRKFADRIGNRWLKGITSARAAFAVAPPQSV